LEEGDSGHADAFGAADEAEMVGRRCLEADALEWDAEHRRQRFTHRRAVLREFRLLGDNGDVDILETAATVAKQGHGMLDEGARFRTTPTLVVRRKELADVSGSESAEDRVGDGVKDGIGVGVTFQAAAISNADAGQQERPFFVERVNVDPLTDPETQIALH
jgi:hypothetical protein